MSLDPNLPALLDDAERLANRMLGAEVFFDALEWANDSSDLDRYVALCMQAHTVIGKVAAARMVIEDMEVHPKVDLDVVLHRFKIFITVGEALADLNERYLEVVKLRDAY